MTPDLLSTQALFQQHMLGHADAVALLAGSAERRALGLGIYANAYRQRLVEALADAYTKTRAWLGADAFCTAALAYIESHTPSARNLRWYGADFADSLPADKPGRDEAAELARLDWELRGAFDGPDSDVLGPAGLADIAPHAWASVRFEPVPTAQLLSFRFNTVAVWQALDDERPAPPPLRSEAPVQWLVWRKELQPHFRSLGAAEAVLLQAMLDDAGFADACAAAQSVHTTLDAEQIGAWLRQWLDDGLIRALQPAGG